MTDRLIVPGTQPFVLGDAYRALPRQPEAWIVEDLIPTGGLFNMYGNPKSGKSYAALQLAVAVAAGEPSWLSFPIKTHGKVAYLQLDTPRSLWGQRLDKIVEGAGLDISNVYFCDNQMAPYPFDILQEETIITPTGRLTQYPCQDYLRGQVQTLQPVLIIIDTLRELHKGDENDSGQMANTLSALVSCCQPAAVCLLSHARKEATATPGGPRDNLLQDNRGSNYIAGRMDGIMKVSPKRIIYQSRTVERHYLQCKQTAPLGLWSVDAADEYAKIREVLADPSLETLKARCEALGEALGKTPEACRSLLRRNAERLAGHSGAPAVDDDE